MFRNIFKLLLGSLLKNMCKYVGIQKIFDSICKTNWWIEYKIPHKKRAASNKLIHTKIWYNGLYVETYPE